LNAEKVQNVKVVARWFPFKKDSDAAAFNLLEVGQIESAALPLLQ
jgi:hypothetical protein